MATTFGQESFLDLKFNNHWVSEYGLVVVSDGSRYSETLFPEFEHTTTTVPGKTGTIYWGTTVGGRIITKKLVTDGMTSRQYATFRSHFKPGTYAELRFGESAYKYCYAYINDNSNFTFIPFNNRVTIRGVNYNDTIYKGECELSFFLPDPYFYSDYYLGKSTTSPIFDYTNKDWFIESGLPLTTWLALRGSPTQLALGNWYGTAPSTATTITCYHAGNSIARANLSFKRTYANTIVADNIFIQNLWPVNGYEIDDIVLTMPRMMRDIKYVYELVMLYESTWTVANKSRVQIDLEENLDSSISSVLKQMVNVTGTGLTYTTVAALKTAIQTSFIKGKIFLISINGLQLQTRLRSNPDPMYPMINPVTSLEYIIDENIADSLNNRYVLLLSNTGAAADGTLTYQTITCSPAIEYPEIYFRNTYE